MNLRDTLDKVGNIVDIVDFTKFSTGSMAITGEHFIVDCEGNVEDRTIPMVNQYDSSTPFSTFSIGTTYWRVGIAKGGSTGSPELTERTLITHKLDNDVANIAYNWQEYKMYRSNNMYSRKCLTLTTFTPWARVGNSLPGIDTFDCSNAFSTNSISITKSSTTGSPEGKAGTLVTYNIDQINPGMNYQEYNIYLSVNKYKRFVNGDGSWGVLTKM